jgi:hypothetical protein
LAVLHMTTSSRRIFSPSTFLNQAHDIFLSVAHAKTEMEWIWGRVCVCEKGEGGGGGFLPLWKVSLPVQDRVRLRLVSGGSIFFGGGLALHTPLLHLFIQRSLWDLAVGSAATLTKQHHSPWPYCVPLR